MKPLTQYEQTQVLILRKRAECERLEAAALKMDGQPYGADELDWQIDWHIDAAERWENLANDMEEK